MLLKRSGHLYSDDHTNHQGGKILTPGVPLIRGLKKTRLLRLFLQTLGPCCRSVSLRGLAFVELSIQEVCIWPCALVLLSLSLCCFRLLFLLLSLLCLGQDNCSLVLIFNRLFH